MKGNKIWANLGKNAVFIESVGFSDLSSDPVPVDRSFKVFFWDGDKKLRHGMF